MRVPDPDAVLSAWVLLNVGRRHLPLMMLFRTNKERPAGQSKLVTPNMMIPVRAYVCLHSAALRKLMDNKRLGRDALLRSSRDNS